MIDRHYGHLARDGHDHAVALLDAYARDSAAWTSGGRRRTTRESARREGCSIANSLMFGAVDVSGAPPLRDVARPANRGSAYAGEPGEEDEECGEDSGERRVAREAGW